MSGALTWRGRAARSARSAQRWSRGVRARLMATYVLAAALAASAGVVLFGYLLADTLRANVDTELRAAAAAVAVDIRNGDVGHTDPPPSPDPARAHGSPASVTAVYDPAGQLVDAQPTVLPAPITGTGATRPATSAFTTGSYGDRSFRFFRTHVHASDGTWVVVVGQNLAASEDANSDARHVLYTIVPIAIVLSGIGAWLLSGAALRPVDRMRADAQRLSETHLPGSIGLPPSSDSLHKLARTFNTLLSRQHTSMQRQRDLVADAGHELRTPLAVLQTELETAVRPGRSHADLVDSIRHAQREAARLAALSEDLLLLAQADGPGRIVRLELLEVADAVATVCAAHRDGFRAAGVQLTAPDRAVTPVLGELDPVALRRMLDNVLANALRHTPAGGTVTVEVGRLTRGGQDDILIAVRDSGRGFPVDFLPHAFERFARADRSRSRSSSTSGSGLGLSIVATLAGAHGGAVAAQNNPEGGARIVLTLPRCARE